MQRVLENVGTVDVLRVGPDPVTFPMSVDTLLNNGDESSVFLPPLSHRVDGVDHLLTFRVMAKLESDFTTVSVPHDPII